MNGPSRPRALLLVIAVMSVATLIAAGRSQPSDQRTPLTVGADAHLDVVYGDGPRSRLDVYVPEGSGPHPVIVYLHPGGWVAGDKSLSMPVWDWTDRGYAVVAVNYRYASPPDSIAGSVSDTADALAFIAANGSQWDLDRDRMGLLGFSAGGHLAVLLAEGGETPVAAVASIGAPTDLVGLLDPSTPFFDGEGGAEVVATMATRLGCAATVDDACLSEAQRLSPTQGPAPAVPMLIVHGADDGIVSVDHAIALFDHLERLGADVELQVVEDAGHAAFTDDLEDFFAAHLRATT